MKIVQLIPGSGGTFYCQNCLRDGLLVRGLRRRGHDVIVVPLYLPISIDAEGLATSAPVFFGGVNVFLQQRLGLFRRTPRWIDRILDSPWMLKQAAMREGTTNAAELGPMTFSMLQGKDGRQRKELERLVVWLADQEKPDLIHLSNTLLLGAIPEIREALKVPVVCTLQDEDTWVDAMDAPWRERCWNLIAERAQDVDAFASVSGWYADKMATRLRVPRSKITIVPLGIEAEALEAKPHSHDRPVLGYLSRISESQGFGLLVDAFIRLRQDPRLSGLRLRATGGVTAHDRQFLKEIHRKLASAGLAEDVEIIGEFGHAARREFLDSMTVLSVPSPQGESFGMFTLEAGERGVPVVQPDAGAFREVVEMTGGGLVYDPSDRDALTETLRRVLLDPELARSLGASARAAVLSRFTSDAMAERMASVYESVVQR